MGCRLLSIAALPSQNTTVPSSPVCFIWTIENSTLDQISKGPFMPRVFTGRPDTARVRNLSTLIAQTPPVHTERQERPKGDCLFCLQTEGFVWVDFFWKSTSYSKHFTQTTPHVRQLQANPSHEPQHTSAMTNTSNIMTEMAGQRFVMKGDVCRSEC